MAGNFTTPNMNLTVPVVGVELGPDWANDLNASLTVIDAHTHVPGSGVQITPAAININTDLSWNNDNNAVALRSVRFNPQTSVAQASDLGCLYEVGVDLFYNDGNGNQVRITQSGSLAGAAGTITGLPSGTASASYQSISGTFQFQQATGVAANVDVGSVIVRYPGSYPTPSGNAILLEAPSSLASQYALILPALPMQLNVMTLNTDGTISSVTWDTVATSFTTTGTDAIIATMGTAGADQIGVNMSATGANAVAASRTRTVNSNPGIGGVSIGGSTGVFSTSNTSFQTISVTATTLTTSGRPVCISVTSSPSGAGAWQNTNLGTGGPATSTITVQGAATNMNYDFKTNASSADYGFLPSILGYDLVPAGTYTYTLALKTSSSQLTTVLSNYLLAVYEL